MTSSQRWPSLLPFKAIKFMYDWSFLVVKVRSSAVMKVSYIFMLYRQGMINGDWLFTTKAVFEGPGLGIHRRYWGARHTETCSERFQLEVRRTGRQQAARCHFSVLMQFATVNFPSCQIQLMLVFEWKVCLSNNTGLLWGEHHCRVSHGSGNFAVVPYDVKNFPLTFAERDEGTSNASFPRSYLYTFSLQTIRYLWNFARAYFA